MTKMFEYFATAESIRRVLHYIYYMYYSPVKDAFVLPFYNKPVEGTTSNRKT